MKTETTTTTEGRSFERPVRPTHCEGLPIVAWHCSWDACGEGIGWDQYHDDSDPMPDKWDDEEPDEVAALVMATDVAHKIETLRALIANDAYACTFQSLGQYRSALLAALSNTQGDS
jgi:hypothetical protein